MFFFIVIVVNKLCNLYLLGTPWKKFLEPSLHNGCPPDHHLEKTHYVPECLSSHLTTCYFKGFSGHEVEMELVQQVLKEAYMLKTMNITFESCLDSEIKLHARKKYESFKGGILLVKLNLTKDNSIFKFSFLICEKQ